jgi:hypothetical protein
MVSVYIARSGVTQRGWATVNSVTVLTTADAPTLQAYEGWPRLRRALRLRGRWRGFLGGRSGAGPRALDRQRGLQSALRGRARPLGRGSLAALRGGWRHDRSRRFGALRRKRSRTGPGLCVVVWHPTGRVGRVFGRSKRRLASHLGTDHRGLNLPRCSMSRCFRPRLRCRGWLHDGFGRSGVTRGFDTRWRRGCEWRCGLARGGPGL